MRSTSVSTAQASSTGTLTSNSLVSSIGRRSSRVSMSAASPGHATSPTSSGRPAISRRAPSSPVVGSSGQTVAAEADRVAPPALVGRHDDRLGAGDGRHRPPGLGPDEGLVGEADHDGVEATDVGGVHGHGQRGRLAVGPVGVVEQERRRAAAPAPGRRRRRPRTRRRRGGVERGLDGPGHQRTTPEVGHLLGLVTEAGGAAGGEHGAGQPAGSIDHRTSQPPVSRVTAMAKDAPPPVVEDLEVTMLMADAAQVADGRLNLLGAGIAVVPPHPQPLALALVVQGAVEPGRRDHPVGVRAARGRRHAGDGGRGPRAGERPGERRSAGRAGPRASPSRCPSSSASTACRWSPAAAYVWRLVIDGASDDRWSLGFSVLQDVRTA